MSRMENLGFNPYQSPSGASESSQEDPVRAWRRLVLALYSITSPKELDSRLDEIVLGYREEHRRSVIEYLIQLAVQEMERVRKEYERMQPGFFGGIFGAKSFGIGGTTWDRQIDSWTGLIVHLEKYQKDLTKQHKDEEKAEES